MIKDELGMLITNRTAIVSDGSSSLIHFLSWAPSVFVAFSDENGVVCRKSCTGCWRRWKTSPSDAVP